MYNREQLQIYPINIVDRSWLREACLDIHYPIFSPRRNVPHCPLKLLIKASVLAPNTNSVSIEHSLKLLIKFIMYISPNLLTNKLRKGFYKEIKASL